MRHQAEPFFEAVTRLVFVSDPPEKADAIFIPGSSHPEPVLLAASLYRQGLAPVVIPSGRYGIGKQRFACDGFDTEADWMASLLRDNGVPERAILADREATYTWENAKRSRGVCDRAGLFIRRGLLCCRPFHARRALMYYQTAFPEARWIACPSREDGVSAGDWYQTPEGRSRVLGEVRRLGDQINEQLEELIRHG